MKKLIVVVDMQNEFLNWQPDEVKNTLPTKVDQQKLQIILGRR